MSVAVWTGDRVWPIVFALRASGVMPQGFKSSPVRWRKYNQMADKICNDTDEAITIEPGETIKVQTETEHKRTLSSRPKKHTIKKVFEDWQG